MIKIKKCGFTLSEVLITLAVVGVLAALVVPGLVRDSNNRAMMAMLQGTVTNISDMVQNELVKTRARQIEDTDIYLDPQKFLENFDTSQGDAFGDSYTSANGTAVTVSAEKSVLFKNGVGVGITNDKTNRTSKIGIDLNGPNDPNIVGIDYFEVELIWDTDSEKSRHLGDVGAYSDDNSGSTLSLSSEQTKCKGGDAKACYTLVELSGFDSNYMVNEY